MAVNIEGIKRRGQARALVDEIRDSRFRISSHLMGGEFIKNGKVHNLRYNIEFAKERLNDLELMLEALQQLEKGHS